MNDNNETYQLKLLNVVMKYKFAIISFLSLSAIALFFSVGFNFPSENKIKVVPKKNVPNDTTFTLLFGGDMMGHQPMINAAFNDSTKTYEYDQIGRAHV